MTTVTTLKNSGFEVLTYSDVVEQNKISHTDDNIIYEMNRVRANILLSNPYMARYWFFSNENNMLNYFDNNNQVSYDNCSQLLA